MSESISFSVEFHIELLTTSRLISHIEARCRAFVVIGDIRTIGIFRSSEKVFVTHASDFNSGR